MIIAGLFGFIFLAKSIKVLIFGFDKKVKCVEKFVGKVKGFIGFLLESNFLDLSFYAFYNLISYRRSIDWNMAFGQLASLAILSWIIFFYFNLSYKAFSNKTEKMTKFEISLIEEGLNKKSLKKSNSLRIVNSMFRLKTIVLVAIIVLYQNMPIICLTSLMIVQIAYSIFMTKTFLKLGITKTFQTTLNLVSFISLEIYINCFFIGCFWFHKINEEVRREDLNKNLKLKKFLIFGAVYCLLLELVIGVLKTVTSLCNRVKKKKEKIKPGISTIGLLGSVRKVILRNMKYGNKNGIFGKKMGKRNLGKAQALKKGKSLKKGQTLRVKLPKGAEGLMSRKKQSMKKRRRDSERIDFLRGETLDADATRKNKDSKKNKPMFRKFGLNLKRLGIRSKMSNKKMIIGRNPKTPFQKRTSLK
jgi:hypothetical protein